MTLKPSPPRWVALVSASIGAGHDGAARELARPVTAAPFTGQDPAGVIGALAGVEAPSVDAAPVGVPALLGAA